MDDSNSQRLELRTASPRRDCSKPSLSNGTSQLKDPLKKARGRPRTYPYFKYVPYELEDEEERQRNFQEILKYLYIAVEAGDFSLGVVHWTRELRAWLSLKFDPTREQRAKLVRLYYDLALAPGIDAVVAERFASMFMALTKYVSPALVRYSFCVRGM
jgi:proteasome activator subunit 4